MFVSLPEDALDALVNEGEGAGLFAVAPHLEVLAGCNSFSAESGRGLLTSALPGSVRAVDVVEAANSALHAEVFRVMLAKLLTA